MLTEIIHDFCSFCSEELAKHLQEEERRAAMAEANDPQRRQGQPAPQQHSQQPSSQRRAVRGNGQHKEEKKDVSDNNYQVIHINIYL